MITGGVRTGNNGGGGLYNFGDDNGCNDGSGL